MKPIFMIFVVFTITNCSATPISVEDLMAKRNELLEKIEVLFRSLENVRRIIKTAPQDLNDTLPDSFDFGVSKNEKMNLLKEKLQEHRLSKNITSCKNLFYSDAKALKTIFGFVFWLGVNSELEDDSETADHIEITLEYISNDLRGEKLQKLIKACESTPEDCKITKQYPNDVFNAKKKLDDLEKLPNSLIESIINNDFHKQISERVDEEVYPQVLDCINKLTNS